MSSKTNLHIMAIHDPQQLAGYIIDLFPIAVKQRRPADEEVDQRPVTRDHQSTDGNSTDDETVQHGDDGDGDGDEESSKDSADYHTETPITDLSSFHLPYRPSTDKRKECRIDETKIGV